MWEGYSYRDVMPTNTSHRGDYPSGPASDELLDERAAANYLQKPPGTLQQWRYLGKGPAYFKFGRSVRYSRSDLRAFRDAHRVEPRGTHPR